MSALPYRFDYLRDGEIDRQAGKTVINAAKIAYIQGWLQATIGVRSTLIIERNGESTWIGLRLVLGHGTAEVAVLWLEQYRRKRPSPECIKKRLESMIGRRWTA